MRRATTPCSGHSPRTGRRSEGSSVTSSGSTLRKRAQRCLVRDLDRMGLALGADHEVDRPVLKVPATP